MTNIEDSVITVFSQLNNNVTIPAATVQLRFHVYQRTENPVYAGIRMEVIRPIGMTLSSQGKPSP